MEEMMPWRVEEEEQEEGERLSSVISSVRVDKVDVGSISVDVEWVSSSFLGWISIAFPVLLCCVFDVFGPAEGAR